MADRGIMFSAPMVRALIDGRKTQTRRLLNPAPPSWVYPNDRPGFSCLTPKGHIEFRGRYVDADGVDHGPASKFIKLPFLKGDRLYVRESYFQFGHWRAVEVELTATGKQKWAFFGTDLMVEFEEPADYLTSRSKFFPGAPRWYKRLGRFMPRNLSRMWLEVTDVRVQRLQECSEADAKAEGLGEDENDFDGMDPRCWYRDLWDSLHTAEGERWENNPWVVAVSFIVHHGNIDAVPA